MKKVVIITTLCWLGLSFAGLTWYLATQEWLWQAMYYYVWLFVFGIPLWINRKHVAHLLQTWKMTEWKKFLLLGYGMVLLEEIFAALFNHLSEGFDAGIYLIRIGQFWSFNIIAFTGLIIGWYFLLKKVNYQAWEVFFLCGLWGVYAEGAINLLVNKEIIDFFVVFPIDLFTYGLIMTPAILSLKQTGERKFHPILKVLMGFIVPLLLSIIPDTLGHLLRSNIPEMFPPREFIP